MSTPLATALRATTIRLRLTAPPSGDSEYLVARGMSVLSSGVASLHFHTTQFINKNRNLFNS